MIFCSNQIFHDDTFFNFHFFGSQASFDTVKVAPSFLFLNINMPIFVETVFKLSQEDVV